MDINFVLIAISAVLGALGMQFYTLLNTMHPPQPTMELTKKPSARLLRAALNRTRIIDKTTKINDIIFNLYIGRFRMNDTEIKIRSFYTTPEVHSRGYSTKYDTFFHESTCLIDINHPANDDISPENFRLRLREEVIAHLMNFSKCPLSVNTIACIYDTALGWVDDLGRQID